MLSKKQAAALLEFTKGASERQDGILLNGTQALGTNGVILAVLPVESAEVGLMDRKTVTTALKGLPVDGLVFPGEEFSVSATGAAIPVDGDVTPPSLDRIFPESPEDRVSMSVKNLEALVKAAKKTGGPEATIHWDIKRTPPKTVQVFPVQTRNPVVFSVVTEPGKEAVFRGAIMPIVET